MIQAFFVDVFGPFLTLMMAGTFTLFVVVRIIRGGGK